MSPLEASEALLSALGITRVVLIDDDFAVTPETALELCRATERSELESSGFFSKVDLSIDDRDVRFSLIEKHVAELEPADLTALARALQRDDAVDEGSVAPDLRNLIPKPIELLTLSYTEWQAQRQEILDAAAEAPIFILIDEDLSNEGFSANEGHRELVRLRSQLGSSAVPFALLTQTVGDADGEEDLRRKIIASDPPLRDSLVVIAKERLTDKTRFWEALKRAMLACLFDRIKSRVSEAISVAQEHTATTIDEITLEAFDCLVFSAKEGVWAPDTLHRLLTVGREKRVRRQLREDRGTWQVLEQICALGPLPAGDRAPEVREHALALQKTEMYDQACDINTCHLPTELGDLYEAADGLKYVLVNQPCDLLVRARGYRKGRQQDERQSLALLLVDERDQQEPGLGFELPCFDANGTSAFAMPNHAFQVPAWLLDLAVLNPDGCCRISPEASYDIPLEPLWRKRITRLQDRSRAICEMVARSDNDGNIADAAARLPLGSPHRIQITRQDNVDTLVLSLKRIGRVLDPLASQLLAHTCAHLSRAAYPVDLTRVAEEGA